VSPQLFPAHSHARDLVSAERRDLAALLGELSPDEWSLPSLCDGWRVRDVVAHLLYEDTAPLRYVYESIQARGSADKLNDLYVRRARRWSHDELLTRYRRTIDGGVARTSMPRVALADTVIHHQDIRRPLGRPRTIPQERLLSVLEHPDPFIGSRRIMRGLRFEATDVPWSCGEGPVVRASGEALVMAVARRAIDLNDLAGDGVAEFVCRLGPTSGSFPGR